MGRDICFSRQITMDVGTVSQDESTFDIDILEETDSVLVKNTDKIRWLYKDQKNQLVVLEKVREPVAVGSLIELQGSVGRLAEDTRVTKRTIAKLVKPYVRTGTPREVIIGTDVFLAYLQTVKLL